MISREIIKNIKNTDETLEIRVYNGFGNRTVTIETLEEEELYRWDNGYDDKIEYEGVERTPEGEMIQLAEQLRIAKQLRSEVKEKCRITLEIVTIEY
jgi:hypothetical protein